MNKSKTSKRVRLISLITLLIMCFFCAFSLAGCGGYLPGSGSSSSSGSSGGSGGGSSSGGEDTDTTEETLDVSDINDVFIGAIGVYDLIGTEEVFYDKFQNAKVSFDFLVDRQFTAMANYLSGSLNRIYGSSASSSSIISGYGHDKTVMYADVINDVNQKIISGLSTGQLSNSAQLNYSNSISGGYNLICDVTTTTDEGTGETITTFNGYSYSSDLLAENAWIGNGYVNADYIKKALGYIYMNQIEVANADLEISLASDANISLKNNYTTFPLNNSAIVNFDFSSISSIGMSRQYLWNVAYFVAYSLIGETNISNSINLYSSVFSGSAVTALSADNYLTLESAMEKYKGYNIVVKDLVSNMGSLSISSDTTIMPISSETTTLYPSLEKLSYVYYDNVHDICEANNRELWQEDYDFDDYEYSEEESLTEVEIGGYNRLKQIILLPYINTSKFDANSTFVLSGMLIGFQSFKAETYGVEITVSSIYEDGTVSNNDDVSISVSSNIENNKIIFDNTYYLEEDWTGLDFAFDGEFATIKMTNLADVSTLLLENFSSEQKTINYSDDTRIINLAYINVYNDMFANGKMLNVVSSLITIDFNYYDGSNLLFTPENYLMYFELYV